MSNRETKSIKNRLEITKKIIRSDVVQKGIKIEEVPKEFLDDLPSFLMRTNGMIGVKPWLKTRLFETTIASAGMDEYLKELLRNNKAKPEDIPINSLLASFLISTSANRFVFELINQPRHSSKFDLSVGQKDALSLVLKPKKDYAFSGKDIAFRSEQIQNIRNAVLRRSLDILSAFEQYRTLDFQKGPQIFNKIPSDLKRVSSLPDFTIGQLVLISRKYGLKLKLSLVGGYLIWQFQDQPAIFIKDRQAYYSPKHSQIKRTTTFGQADRQVYHLIEQLETTLIPRLRCSICGERSTSQLFYHLDKGVIPICLECARNEKKVVGFVSKIIHKT